MEGRENLKGENFWPRFFDLEKTYLFRVLEIIRVALKIPQKFRVVFWPSLGGFPPSSLRENSC